MADVARMVAVLAILLLAASPGAHGSFACDGGSIPDAWVNDDYCDCADGLDEPRTGACPDTLFHCPCAPHRPKHVFASRVNDGVCDCCDGSDEWKSDTCPNTCVSLASTDLLRQAHASKLKRERELRGKEAAASRAEKLEKARAELATALPAFEAARAAKVAAEAVEAERKADRERRLAAGEVATALKVGELSGELLRVALARVAISLQVSGADALHDSLAASPSIGQAMDDVDSADLIEVAMEAKDAASAYDSDGPQSAAAQGAPQSCESAGAACGFEVDLLKLLPLDAMPLDELRSLVRGFAEEHGQITLLARVSASSTLHTRARRERVSGPTASCEWYYASSSRVWSYASRTGLCGAAARRRRESRRGCSRCCAHAAGALQGRGGGRGARRPRRARRFAKQTQGNY